MKRILVFSLTLALCLTAGARGFYSPKYLDTANCKLRVYNFDSIRFMELDAKDMVFSITPGADVQIRDEELQFTVADTLYSPAWANLPAWLISVQKACKVTSPQISIDSSGPTTVNSTNTEVTINAGPAFTVNIDTANITLSRTNDSAFTWLVTDSLTLGAGKYNHIDYSVIDSTATIRIGGTSTPNIPAGTTGHWDSDAVIIQQIRFVTTGRVLVNATK